ncbi:hypothetical protein, variant [Exophiala mesophila]|nr:hypothetical protein, variant [Exophiala mesophila]KIV96017.1 hypothetical protein, variant [Exophiala mesophila]
MGVASAGFRLSLILNAISTEAAHAGQQVHAVSKGVTLFSQVLKQAGTAFQTHDSVHSYDALVTAKSIADDGTKVFDEINDMLDRVRAKPLNDTWTPTAGQRFDWCFKKHRVTYLLAQLDSLKLSICVMLQVLQLGKLMASTSRNDPPEEVTIKTEAIRQERAEAQNGLIVRYWHINQMDYLFEQSMQEEERDRQGAIGGPEGDNVPPDPVGGNLQIAVRLPPPQYALSTALVKLPIYSLGELDQTLDRIRDSPRDMIHVSDQAIDPLLDRWTNWREIREKKHHRTSGSRYVPSVQNLKEDDEDRPLHDRFEDPESNSRGYFIEGTTTDWRKPNSASARQEASRRRKQYSQYQPSVSAASSDMEDSPGSTASKKPSSRRHVISSGSESSTSEPEMSFPKPRRRSSGSPTAERRSGTNDGPPLTHAYTAPTPWIGAVVNGAARPPSVISSSQSAASRLSSPAYLPPGHRPWATPDQSLMHQQHHSLSSPLPPVHTANALNPYAPSPAGYPRYYKPPQPPQPQQPQPPMPYTNQSSGQLRYPAHHNAGRMPLPPRPVSQDGKQRSPSRLSQQSTTPRAHEVDGREHPRRHAKEKTTKQNLREGATKGLLGAGAIAGFFEALEGLSI